jgi:flagellar motility protein MotE (MotC chaperone)
MRTGPPERQVKELEQRGQEAGPQQELESHLKRLLRCPPPEVRKLRIWYVNPHEGPAAAQLLSTLDEKIAVKILAGMRGRQAGEILSFVPAEKAAKLSEALTKLQVPFQ